jgi:hypothetical protein
MAIFLCSLQPKNSQGQTMLAKLKFEEAEQAFQNKQFNSALLLIDEVENIIAGTSPKTLYLKILSIKESGIKDFKTLQKLREHCKFFLEKYAEVTDIEDRYREVYDISKTLNKLPSTEEEFNVALKIQKQRRQEEDAKRESQILLEQRNKQLELFPFGEYNLNVGLTADDVINLVPKSVFSKFSDYGINYGLYMLAIRPSGMKLQNAIGFNNICFDGDGKVYSLRKTYLTGGKSDFDQALSKLKSLEEKMIGVFGRENVIYKDTSYYNSSVKCNYRYITVQLSDDYPIAITITLNRMDMGGLLGSSIDLSQERTLKYKKPIKQ